jgi:hypothetical protein
MYTISITLRYCCECGRQAHTAGNPSTVAYLVEKSRQVTDRALRCGVTQGIQLEISFFDPESLKLYRSSTRLQGQKDVGSKKPVSALAYGSTAPIVGGVGRFVA